MNTTFVVELWREYEKVSFYTVRYEDEEYSETMKFLRKISVNPEYREELKAIVNLIYHMGENRGALESYFNRPEDESTALPPRRSGEIEPQYYPNGNKLRLYCLRVCDSIVILYNGGYKENNTNSESPDVWPFFRDSKTFSRKILKALSEDVIVPIPVKKRLECGVFGPDVEIIVS